VRLYDHYGTPLPGKWRDGAPPALLCHGKGVDTYHRRDGMKQSTKDAAKGKFHEVKGTVKETVGRVMNNPHLEVEGQDEKIEGKIQKKIGQVKKVLGK
jgi:uncharacterized protein YjbJ (UPF0337 family)